MSKSSPDTVFLPRILNTPSRLRCDFGWNQDTTEAFQSNTFEQLILKGSAQYVFHIPNLGKKAKKLRKLVLQTSGEVTGLEQFGEIRNLSLATIPANGIDLFCFPKLDQLFVEWDKALTSQVFELSQLTSIGFNTYPYKDLGALSKMSGLNELGITRGSLKTIGGIQKNRKISCISLAYLRNLSDVDDLSCLQDLERLDFANLPNLRSSLRISDFPKLQRLYVVDSPVNIDLTGISACSNLEMLWLNVPASGMDWRELLSLQGLKTIGVIEAPDSPVDEETLRQLASERGYLINDFKKSRLKKTRIRSGAGVQIKLSRSKLS